MVDQEKKLFVNMIEKVYYLSVRLFNLQTSTRSDEFIHSEHTEQTGVLSKILLTTKLTSPAIIWCVIDKLGRWLKSLGKKDESSWFGPYRFTGNLCKEKIRPVTISYLFFYITVRALFYWNHWVNCLFLTSCNCVFL